MLSFLFGWRVSLRRTTSDWPIVTAAAIVLLLAATLLAAGPIYSSAVAEAGLHRRLATAATADANVEVTAWVRGDAAAATLDSVSAVLMQEIGRSGAGVLAMGISGSFALPGQAPADVRDLTELGFLDGLADHATLVAGEWPRVSAPGSPIEVAVLDSVAATLGLEVGRTLELASRLDPTWTEPVVVVATFRPTDPAAAFWFQDARLLVGESSSQQYRTLGPLLTTREDLLGRGGRTGIALTWHAFPVVDGIRIDAVPDLRIRMEQLAARVSDAVPGGSPTTRTGLPALLAETERSLLVSRTGVLLLLVQLAMLAAYAVALTADLVLEHRRVDLTLMRSRGASSLQVGALALTEALLLAVPSALLGPWLASAVLRVFNVVGPLAEIGLQIDPVVTSEAYLVAGLTALGCSALIVLPALAAARRFGSDRAERSRPGSRPLGQRLGLDIALLAVAGIGLWQLSLYGTPLTRTGRGVLGIDPLLVAAPALGILAGSVLALRVVPTLAAVADALSARGRDLIGSLGARQLARRPLRYTRTALLIMLAVSMGVFSVAYGATWVASQRDQADYQVGADLRVIPYRGIGLPGWAAGRAYAAVDGVTGQMAVSRDVIRFTRSTGNGELVALDAGVASSVLDAGRSTPPASLGAFQSLVDARPEVDALGVPGDPARLAVDVVVDLRTFYPGRDPETGASVEVPLGPEVAATARLVPTLTIRDGRGLLHQFRGPAAPLAPAAQRLVVPVLPTASSQREQVSRLGGGLEAPIEVVGIDLEIRLPRNSLGSGRLAVTSISTSGAADGSAWQQVAIGGPADWTVRFAYPALASADVDTASTQPGVSTLLDHLGGIDANGRGRILSLMTPGLIRVARDDLAAVVNRAFLDVTAAEENSRLLVQLQDGPHWLRIVGVVEAFPTTAPTQAVAVVDLPTLSATRYGGDRQTQVVDEWWLDVDPAALAELVDDAPGGALAGARLVGRDATRDQLISEPLAVSMIGAMSFGSLVTGLFAVLGLVVSAAVSARQRKTEFALLRALGLSPGQLSGWLWLENASVALLSLLAGTGLGILIGLIVLPLTTISQTGAAPFPPIVVDLPWSSILLLDLAIAAALVVPLSILVVAILRAGMGNALRIGEDPT